MTYAEGPQGEDYNDVYSPRGFYVHFNGDVVDSIGAAAPPEARREGGRDGLGFGIHATRESAEAYALDVWRDACGLEGMSPEAVFSVGGVLVYAMTGEEPSDADPLLARAEYDEIVPVEA